MAGLVFWMAVAGGASADEAAPGQAPDPVQPLAVDSAPADTAAAGIGAPVDGAGADTTAVPPDSTEAQAAEDPEKPDPVPFAFTRAVQSAVFPAWGQVANGRKVKAAVLFGFQTYIWTRVVVQTQRGREWQQEVDRLEAAGGSSAEVAHAEALAEEHFDTRRDLLFWAIIGSFYGALDAYIDAHLGDFDRELEEGRGLFAEVGPSAAHVGYRF
ncbi:MAG: DUF5683 domain-containing protein [Candidatus Eiseniibacteriota bacterium]